MKIFFDKKNIIFYLHQNLPNLVSFYTKNIHKSTICFLLFLCFAKLPNYTFISLSIRSTYERPVLTVEWVACFILILFRFNITATLAFAFNLANEITLALSEKLQLLTLEQVFGILSFVFYMNRSHLLYAVLIIFATTGIFCLLTYSAQKITLKKPYMLLSAYLAFTL